MLAMGVNDNEGCLNERGALTFIVSELAPTERAERLQIPNTVFS
jgi:hypothetical protein